MNNYCFFLLSMLSLRLCVINCSVKMEVFRSPGSRGPRSDLVLVPLFRFFAFHLSFLFFFISLGLPLSNYYRARCDTKHINSEIYFLRVAFDNSML